MEYLVIGSNSFSGSWFINNLIDKGHDVFGISRSQQNNDVFLPYKWNKKKANFKFKRLDLNKDIKEIGNLIKKYKFKKIINFAAQGMVAESWVNPNHWYQTNLLSSTSLIDQIRKHDFIDKYIHFTTPEVYGSNKKFIKENNNFKPSTPYAISRAAFDMHLLAYKKNYDFPVIFTRTANVFGEGQQLYRIVPKTIISCLLKEKLQLHGGGKSIRSFIHINDVNEALYKIFTKSNQFGSTYHISTNEIISIKNLVLKIFELMDIDPKDLIKVTSEREGKDFGYLLNSDKIRSELKWKDKITLDKGIRDTISWIKNNIKVLKKHPRVYKHKI